MVIVNENETLLKNYDSISEDVKFVSKSLIRLKILAALFEESQTMKSLTEKTSLSYSSISSAIHSLELKGYVFRESNKYFLSNNMKLYMNYVLEFKSIVNLLNKFFNILDGHVVTMIPNQSVYELYLLGNAKLLESDGVDVYKIYNYIENAINEAENLKCILPFFYDDFNNALNALVDKGAFVEVMVPEDIYETFEEKSEIRYLSSFDGDERFLLIVSDKIMILGLFKNNGFFDQNRLLTSKNSDAIEWANNLFKNFKNKNK